MQHTAHVPPVDFRTNGHLPALVADAVEQTRQCADELAAAALVADTAPERTSDCPDGVWFCEGYADEHREPGEHLHMGRITFMRGPYVGSNEGINGFHLSQIQGEEPHIEFVGDGSWPENDLAGTDRLIGDMTAHLVALRVARRQLADMLHPARTPLDESDAEQTSDAAFALAADALAIALEQSPDRSATLAAMRSLVELHAAEDRA
ncbi:hypothetical protein ABZ330_01670 [Streptomyces sp. NPDC006172]|uniref:hypothetical protein n=1 Tax=Streptomyces sp. NPDC006172 TaxID=3154470 RepID=UPI0034028995